MKNPVFTGSAVAIITPMNDDFSVNVVQPVKALHFVLFTILKQLSFV